MQKIVEVVAGLFFDDRGRFMIARRPAHKQRGLLWEFVGGKIEKGESGDIALKRECLEEIGCDIEVSGEFCSLVHEYPDMTVRLTVYKGKLLGEYKLLEHSEIRFIDISEKDSFDFCPADIPVLEKIEKEFNNKA